MKKRIFISMHYMEIGGAETSLIGLLKAIDYRRFEVDLFLHVHRGELIKFLPKEVNLLPEIKSYAHIECPMIMALRDGCWGILYGRIKAKIKTWRYIIKRGITDTAAGLQFVARSVSPFLPSLDYLGEYDLAISYLTPHNYVLDKVNAKKKVCWIHTDYSQIDVDTAQELPIWKAFDYIVSVSHDVSKAFLCRFPSLSEKIVEMENILSPDFVRSRADEFDVTEEIIRHCDGKSIRLLSVGRFCEAKNYDNVPDICYRIIREGWSIVWFIIGYGGEEELIRRKIHEKRMENNVILLGKRSNPYPYIKACDIYVQPSRYEGKSVTVREAQMLFKPVVITDYPTASSQVLNGVDGVIVPMDNEGCAKGISNVIQDSNKQETIIEYLRNHDYGNEDSIHILYDLS